MQHTEFNTRYAEGSLGVAVLLGPKPDFHFFFGKVDGNTVVGLARAAVLSSFYRVVSGDKRKRRLLWAQVQTRGLI